MAVLELCSCHLCKIVGRRFCIRRIEIEFALKSRVLPWYLRTACCFSNLPPDSRQHLAHFESRRLQVMEKRCREWAVGALAIGRDHAGRRRKRNQCSNSSGYLPKPGSRQIPAARAQPSLQRVIAAGIEKQNAYSGSALCLFQHRLKVERLKSQITRCLDPCCHRQKPTAATDLKGMACIEEDCCIRLSGLLAEPSNCHLHSEPIRIQHRLDRKSETLQRLADSSGIVERVGQSRCILVGTDANDQCGSAVCCPCGYLADEQSNC
ncbi:hypothetical protein Mnod_3058 [Methylobacterium nodulans ORS 2060]|uniref:Uncharacterized protein n=1 Tax=Methylobacterium nodulans (strain LMG 21967 / CNCM I-2342 / ORS 2060) TaxID=460265 RepID=B8IID0_METNO|nr:hypothetical protein Mnod_3058 [Methylobacterium nodulans ORS 2060]